MKVDSRDTYTGEDTLLWHDDEHVTGEVEYRDANGNLILAADYWEGVKHGRQQEWYPDGAKRAEGGINMGAAVGEWRKWHPNGQLAELRTFAENGNPLHRTRWDRDGNLTEDKQLGGRA
ncbi:toxin-antitoxin system YwqK family antitoxin [Nocardia sp. SYP-A9097]|uniref:toxin-antitoxin system YwqK family antitoxin n=1 Tax=Nocardia sp. SYP-A9097 TaxID=2663237 RepID=UPI001890DE6C|nr:hypothetical protein [Nocardia sp. SYP-A9097]